jgi:exopolysaccharide biosynthesis polyprenyl glycosylphosphotransferase
VFAIAAIAVSSATNEQVPVTPDGAYVVDDRTRSILRHRRAWKYPVRRSWLLRRALMLADIVGIFLAFVLASHLTGANGDSMSTLVEAALIGLSLPVWIVLMKLHGLYDSDGARADHSTVDEITKVFQVLAIGSWVFFVIVQVTDAFELPLNRLVIFWVSGIIAVTAFRAITRAICRRSFAYIQNAVIVGTGPVGRLVARKLVGHPEYGINLVGFVDGSPVSDNGSLGGLPILGSPAQLHDLVSALDIERVIIAFTPDSHEHTLDVVRNVRDLDIQVDIVPRLFEVVGTNSNVHMLEGIPLVGLPPLSLSASARLLKRTLDLFGAVFGLLLLAPLFAVVALAIKIETRGPVFFRQVRRGELDRTFRIYKFRTMCDDAESRKTDVAHLNMHEGGDPRMFKIPEDPRVTRVGAFLRRWSIDELPQLINVVHGEMSLVGPRPLILEEDRHVESWARKRLELKPGMTGLWQVLGRSDIPFEDMTKLDYMYVTSWSLKEDIRLILLTIPALLRPRKAF